MKDFPLILLAAGASSRMGGRDKLLEEIAGEPLLRRLARRARAATAGPLIVALPPPPHPRYQVLAGLELLCLPVMAAAEGMNASLRTAVAALPEGCPWAMVLLADLPELETADLQKVAAAVAPETGKRIWRGATESGKPGHPIVFHRDLFDQIRGLTGDGGARSVVAAAGDRVQLVPLEGERARTDLDTPEAWAAWRAKRGC
jgi:CTP:molybdopterin cytidylyltransferase MocA